MVKTKTRVGYPENALTMTTRYIKIVKGMYGLKQAGIIAHKDLI